MGYSIGDIVTIEGISGTYGGDVAGFLSLVTPEGIKYFPYNTPVVVGVPEPTKKVK